METKRDPRVPVLVQVRVRYPSILDFHESQSLNISRSGMFVASDTPASVGALIDFDFSLEDGLTLLKGKGEVVRVTASPVPGMGIRFLAMDEISRTCLERIVGLNEREGRTPAVSLEFNRALTSEREVAPPNPTPPKVNRTKTNPLAGATRVQPGLSISGRSMQIRLTPLTVGYFTNNPLINIRLNGFVVPMDEEVALGTSFDVTIDDNNGVSLLRGKGKVVAKHEHRVGIRLNDTDKNALARLQAEVGRLSPSGHS